MMERIKSLECTIDEFKYMHDMCNGEVAYYTDGGHYVLCIRNGDGHLFLILDGCDAINSYQEGCPAKVRSLYPGESVTIKFS